MALYVHVSVPCKSSLTWTETSSTSLALHNHRTLVNITTVDDCKQACLTEGGFQCRSVDYDFDSLQCKLSKYRLADAPDYQLKVEGNISHYDWSCDEGKVTAHFDLFQICSSISLALN